MLFRPTVIGLILRTVMITKQMFDEHQGWGLSAAINLHGCDPAKVRDAAYIRRFVRMLCTQIGVKRFGSCRVVHFGERDEIAGFSMTQLIETSLISGHFVNLTNDVYLDVFSCKYFDPQLVAQLAKQAFEANSVDIDVLLRK